MSGDQERFALTAGRKVNDGEVFAMEASLAAEAAFSLMFTGFDPSEHGFAQPERSHRADAALPRQRRRAERVPASDNAQSVGIRIFVNAGDRPGYSWSMTAQVAALIEQAKSLTTEERAELAHALRATVEVEGRAKQTAPGLIGLFASEPDVVDEAMAHVRRLHQSWHLPDHR